MTTILLIEDALDLARVIRRELEAEGYQVRHAADGLTARMEEACGLRQPIPAYDHAGDDLTKIQLIHDLAERGLGFGDCGAVNQRRFRDQVLARLVEPRSLTLRQRSLTALCKHIAHAMNQCGGFGALLASMKHCGPLPVVAGQAFCRRAKTCLDNLNADR